MKIKQVLLAVFALSLGFTACDKEQEVALTLAIQSEDGKAITAIEIPAEGQIASVNIVSNASWVITNTADWIKIDPSSSINTDKASKSVKVNITVDQNNTTEVRSTNLTVSIEGQEIDLTVSQAAGSSEDQIDYAAAMALYYGDYYDNGTQNWCIQLMDEAFVESATTNNGAGTGICAILDLVAGSSATFDKGLPTGTFTYNKSHAVGTFGESGIFNVESGEIIATGANMITEGTITISTTDKQYTVTLDAGELSFTYVGAMILSDETEGSGSLEGDVELKPVAVEAYYDGTYDVPYWEIYFGDADYVLSMFINTDQKAFSEGIPSGTYTVNDTMQPGSVDIGIFEDNTNYGSWLWTIDGTPLAMLASGTVEVVNKGDDNYTFTLNLVDSEGYKITGSYDGAITTEDTNAMNNAPAKVRAASTAKKIQHHNSFAAKQQTSHKLFNKFAK